MVCGTAACILVKLKLCNIFGHLCLKWISLGTTKQTDTHIIKNQQRWQQRRVLQAALAGKQKTGE